MHVGKQVRVFEGLLDPIRHIPPKQRKLFPFLLAGNSNGSRLKLSESSEFSY
jgi:hypothetical protein